MGRALLNVTGESEEIAGAVHYYELHFVCHGPSSVLALRRIPGQLVQMESGIAQRSLYSHLFVYGITHAVVDAACVGLLFSVQFRYKVPYADFYYLVLLYNFLAFGLQPLCGRLVDYFQSPRESAVFGCVLTAISVFTPSFSPIGAICLTGLGNAFFHVGGGAISLNLTPHRASAPGIFVAPGGLGLTAGILLGQSGKFIPWIFVLLLAICCFGIYALKSIYLNYTRVPVSSPLTAFGLMFLLLFASIAIRSLIGMGVDLPGQTNTVLLIILTLSVASGKALGGILSDRYGWIVVVVTSLAVSAPLIAFANNVPYLGIPGIFLFNMTMAVTLVAISNMFPGQPGFAFGVPCLALIMGAFPAFTNFKQVLSAQWLVFFIIIGSAAALFAGLRLLLNSTDSALGESRHEILLQE